MGRSTLLETRIKPNSPETKARWTLRRGASHLTELQPSELRIPSTGPSNFVEQYYLRSSIRNSGWNIFAVWRLPPISPHPLRLRNFVVWRPIYFQWYHEKLTCRPLPERGTVQSESRQVRLPADIMFLSANDSGLITHRLGSQSHLPAIQINPVLPTVPKAASAITSPLSVLCIQSLHLNSLAQLHSGAQAIMTLAARQVSGLACRASVISPHATQIWEFLHRQSVCRQLFPPFNCEFVLTGVCVCAK